MLISSIGMLELIYDKLKLHWIECVKEELTMLPLANNQITTVILEQV